MILNGVIALI